ncbi:hypothetical protein ACOMHN_058424 [Nucella lapillus]
MSFAVPEELVNMDHGKFRTSPQSAAQLFRAVHTAVLYCGRGTSRTRGVLPNTGSTGTPSERKGSPP